MSRSQVTGEREGGRKDSFRENSEMSVDNYLAPFTSKVKNLLIKIYFYLFIIENVDRSSGKC